MELKDDINLYRRRLKMSLKKKSEVMKLRYEKTMNSRVYKEPLLRINEYYMEIDKYVKQMENITVKKLKDSKIEAAKIITKLDTLSPLKTLTRGYTLVEANSKIITKASDLKKDMEIDIRFQDDKKKAKIL